MYGNTQDPGNWSLFLRRKDNKDLTTMEAKRKYLKEQLEYQSFVNSQLARFEMNRQSMLTQGGGSNPDAIEDIVSWGWDSKGLGVVSGGTVSFVVDFESDIAFENVGTNLVHLLIPNGQQGNGTGATVPFTASKVTGAGNTIQFDYTQAANAAAQGVIGPNVLGTGSINSLVSTPAVNAVGGQYNAVANTATNSGANQVINITVATGSSVDSTADAIVAAISQNTVGATPGTYTDVTFSTVGSGINLTASVTVGGGGTVTGITATSGGSSVMNIRNSYGAGFGGLIKFWKADTSSSVGNIAFNTDTTAVNYNTTSDYRLKEDLQDFAGIDLIQRMKVYDYKWINYESRSYGVLAHELQEVLPGAVTGEKDDEEMQGVDYSKVVPVLIKAIQELKAEIELLKK